MFGLFRDICPTCHHDRNYKHERDGTYMCWCRYCDKCNERNIPEDADDDICDACKAKELT